MLPSSACSLQCSTTGMGCRLGWGQDGGRGWDGDRLGAGWMSWKRCGKASRRGRPWWLLTASYRSTVGMWAALAEAILGFSINPFTFCWLPVRRPLGFWLYYQITSNSCMLEIGFMLSWNMYGLCCSTLPALSARFFLHLLTQPAEDSCFIPDIPFLRLGTLMN